MAKHHTKSEISVNKTTKAERHYTMGYVTQNAKINLLPSIHIKDHWLKLIGFFSGQAITITIEDDKLIIESLIQF